MALNIPVGISNFTEIRSNNYYYVDKTNLIYELLQSPGTEVIMITRPRRFGKTLAMSMLESFDIRKASKVLFEGLDIMSHQSLCEEWMNKWPVIFVSFRQVDGLDLTVHVRCFLLLSQSFLMSIYICLMMRGLLNTRERHLEILLQERQRRPSLRTAYGFLQRS